MEDGVHHDLGGRDLVEDPAGEAANEGSACGGVDQSVGFGVAPDRGETGVDGSQEVGDRISLRTVLIIDAHRRSTAEPGGASRGLVADADGEEILDSWSYSALRFAMSSRTAGTSSTGTSIMV